MSNQALFPKCALLSVSDKTGLVPFARGLVERGIVLYSTGGTEKHLLENDVPVKHVSDITDFPEIMQGRVKTLHPKLLGGVLGLRDQHAHDAQTHEIPWIDMVVCNLYPFAEVIEDPNISQKLALENIDVGGPTMVRAAAKNFPWVSVVTSNKDYREVLESLHKDGISFQFRKYLSQKAFAHTAKYDATIANYLSESTFPDDMQLNFSKVAELRYGENPHQPSCLYRNDDKTMTILDAMQLHGKQLSYNNLVDAQAAIDCVAYREKPTVSVIKHAIPCGLASNDCAAEAFFNAFYADKQSAFGGVIAVNRPVDEVIAKALSEYFVEIVIAPDFTDAALSLLQQKKNVRLLKLSDSSAANLYEHKYLPGGLLIQKRDDANLTSLDLQVMTDESLNEETTQELLFAWHAVKQVKSNAIVITMNETTVGIGGGQVSRVDATKQAIDKAGVNTRGAILGSDGFFPFRDCVDLAAQAGIRAIIQPGGSMRDQDVIDACKEHQIALIFTGIRAFKH